MPIGEECAALKIQESGEMYLENILILREKQGCVRAIDVVNLTGYSKPSISRALGVLKKDEMLIVDQDGFISLTASGEARAQKIYERHRILTGFLRSLGVSDKAAAEDACKMEHVISDESFAKIKEFGAQA